jgi:hypothetical protein
MAVGSADLRTEENFMTVTPGTTQVEWIEVATIRHEVEDDQLPTELDNSEPERSI